MLRHYVTNILPNGFKAQVVAYSRLAAVRYLDASTPPGTSCWPRPTALSPRTRPGRRGAVQRPPKVQAAGAGLALRDAGAARVRAHHLGSNNDDPAWKQVDRFSGAQEQRIKRFKKPLLHKPTPKTDPLAFLIVKSMLLTGFDAPIEGVMYLDRPIREAELLQAIARVNRTGHGKQLGIVVDYYGWRTT
jgi:type I restriction enzyme, R subunit